MSLVEQIRKELMFLRSRSPGAQYWPWLFLKKTVIGLLASYEKTNDFQSLRQAVQAMDAAKYWTSKRFSIIQDRRGNLELSVGQF